MKYIGKDALVAEIDRQKDEYLKHSRNKCHAEWSCGTLDNILSFINTLEVKEVDLEKEIYDAEKRFGNIDEMGGYRILIFDDEFRDILRHFFELGLKAQKGE